MEINQNEEVQPNFVEIVPGNWDPDGPSPTLQQRIHEFKEFTKFLETDEEFKMLNKNFNNNYPDKFQLD